MPLLHPPLDWAALQRAYLHVHRSRHLQMQYKRGFDSRRGNSWSTHSKYNIGRKVGREVIGSSFSVPRAIYCYCEASLQRTQNAMMITIPPQTGEEYRSFALEHYESIELADTKAMHIHRTRKLSPFPPSHSHCIQRLCLERKWSFEAK